MKKLYLVAALVIPVLLSPSIVYSAPEVTFFDVQPRNTTESITAQWTVTDDQELGMVELLRTEDDNGQPNASRWYTLLGKSQLVNGTMDSGSFTDTPPGGRFWYLLNVTDNESNWNQSQAIMITRSVVIRSGYNVSGDINNDGFVNIMDLSIISLNFGKIQTDQDWNDTADLIPDGEIDIYDLVYICSRFTTANIAASLIPSSGGTGTIVSVPVLINGNQQNITAFGIYNFTYNTSMFSYQNVTRGTLTTDWFAVDGNEVFPGNVISGGFAGAAEPIPTGSSGSIETFNLIVTCSGCSNGQQSQICIFNYIDHIEGMTPEPSCTTFTFT
ncbi:MAG: hypothetical protein JSW41_00365 [Candidatus Aenigmatarchaeota archaeon]|nr:MAG: hypothetical protein JSW41_00365 [Candidatus Aenigmarchaeota archaeon]